MPKISKENLDAQDFGAVEVHTGDLGDYTVDFVSFRETQDMAPMFTGLPDGRCQCPHWGSSSKESRLGVSRIVKRSLRLATRSTSKQATFPSSKPAPK